MIIGLTAKGQRGLAGVLLALSAMPLPSAALAQRQKSAAPMPDWWPGTAERVAARAQIEALSIEYYYRIDHGDAEGVAELFTPDGVFQPGGSQPIVGRDAILAYYARRSKTWVTRHVTTNLRIAYIDADHAEAVRTFTYYKGDSADGPGPYPAIPSVSEYRESIARGADGLWRYTRRVAIGVFSARM